MRDHTKLRAFELADRLALAVYANTRSFPKEETFGLVSQMRRSAVSVACNIVEGCARNTKSDYLRFLDIAFGSVKELGYQISLAHRLAYLEKPSYEKLHEVCEETSKVLNGLIRALRQENY